MHGCIIETLEGGRIVITGPSAGAVQLAIEQIMDSVVNGVASFTFAKLQADGRFVSVGRMLPVELQVVEAFPTAP